MADMAEEWAKRSEPRPRISICGFDDSESNEIRQMSPTAHAQTWPPLPSNRDHSEIDGVFMRGGDVLPHHVASVVWVEEDYSGGDVDGVLNMRTRESSHEITQSKSGESALDDLVHDTIFKTMVDGSHQTHFQNRFSTFGAQDLFEEFVPLIVDKHGMALAIRYRLKGSLLSRFALPVTGTDRARWARYALDRWHLEDSDRFPVPAIIPPANREWFTADECLAAQAVGQKRIEMLDTIQRITSEQEVLDAELQSHTESRISNEGRLLTEKDDSLEEAVSEVLQLFGFQVRNQNQSLGKKTHKLEDLRASRDARFEDDALVEVKSSKRGAKSNELQKWMRYTEAYVKEKGDRPYRKWHVVNPFSETPPEQRRQDLGWDPGEVDSFAENDGLIIPTMELFKAVRAVKLEQVEKSVVMESLWADTGMWKFDHQNEGSIQGLLEDE